MGQNPKYDRNSLQGPNNGVSDQEMEWLTRLMEECGELIQTCAKVQRWGWGSYNPDDEDRITNRQQFRKEAEDVKDIMNRIGISGIRMSSARLEPVKLVIVDHDGAELAAYSVPPIHSGDKIMLMTDTRKLVTGVDTR